MSFNTLGVVAGLSFAFCFVLTPLVRHLARQVGLVDRPDHIRKLHANSIPVAGGIALLIAVTAALAAGCLVPGSLRGDLIEHGRFLLGLLLAAVVICAVGLVDDFITLRVRYKLAGQAAAAGIVMASGLVVRHIGLFGCDLDLGLLAVPFTLFWLLGAINSLNLIDGMDGLLSCVGLIAAAALGMMALLGELGVAACVAFAVAAALLAILRYNFPPASIFLGDSGSMLIGLLVGVVGIQGALKGPTPVALCAPVAILTIPLFDTTMAIVRRKLTGRSIYASDRGHLHHCLLRRGFTSRRVLLLVSALSVVAATGALVSVSLQNELLAVLVMLAVAGVFVITRLFGHAELLLVRERIRAVLPPVLGARAGREPREIRVRLQGDIEWEALWDELTGCAADLRLAAVCLDVNAPVLHEGYYASWHDPSYRPEGRPVWQAEIPVYSHRVPIGRVRVSGHEKEEAFWDKIAAVSKVIGCFDAKVAAGRQADVCAAAPPPALPAPKGPSGEARHVERTPA